MQTPTHWLIANWKMNGTAQGVREYINAIGPAVATLPEAAAFVYCPPAIYLPVADEALGANTRIALGAQDCHAKPSGAHTGEHSALMLKDSGCRYVIVGHSERRIAGETDEQVGAKAAAALEAGLTPVICVGETLAAYEAGDTNAVLNRQCAALSALDLTRCLIAYEPVWAIGTGKTPTPEEIAAVHRHLKTVLGSTVAVLYGGSVNAGNAREILALSEVSGALVGGAGLTLHGMEPIIAALRDL